MSCQKCSDLVKNLFFFRFLVRYLGEMDFFESQLYAVLDGWHARWDGEHGEHTC